MHADDQAPSFIDYEDVDVKRPYETEEFEHSTMPVQMGRAISYDENYYVPKPGRSIRQVLSDHRKYLGPGIMASTAYFDPIFEAGIAVLVFVVFLSLLILFVKIGAPAGPVLLGFLPSSTILRPDAIVTGIAILGAVVMPHGLFLGSMQSSVASIEETNLANETKDIEQPIPQQQLSEQSRLNMLSSLGTTKAPLSIIKHSLPHATWDVGLSLALCAIRGSQHTLLGARVLNRPFAAINTAIMVIAGQAFFGKDGAPADLFDAINLVRRLFAAQVKRLPDSHQVTNLVGKIPGIIFTVALFASGQASSLVGPLFAILSELSLTAPHQLQTASLSGQTVSEGFLQKKINPVWRRLISRSIAIIPCAIIAGEGGREGVNSLILLSQVGLSLLLPFVTLPLVYATVRIAIDYQTLLPAASLTYSQSTKKIMRVWDEENKGWQDFASGWLLCLSAYAIFSIVVIADIYTLAFS
ncbi:hypothetical protein P7C70_g1183, partial [Phenoliferia sp. Uapishka_3]